MSVAQELEMSDADVHAVIRDYLNGHIIAILAYTVYTTIFIATLRQIVARGEWPPQRIAQTSIISMIWVFATIDAGMDWSGLYSTFVTFGQSRDSILGYIMQVGDRSWSKRRLVINIVADTTIALNGILAELVNIWRCWELYHQNWLVVAFPLIGVVGVLISHILNMLAQYWSSTSPMTSASLTTINWAIVYYTITASINILTTALIILRILSVSGIKNARTYRGLITILVESAFLYSSVNIVYLALYVRDFYLPYYSFISWYALAFINAVTASAPTMIIGRVMFGEARPNDSWTRPSLPHMRTTMRSIAESIRFTSFRAAQTQETDASPVDILCELNHGSTDLNVSGLPLPHRDSMTANGASEIFKKQGN